jgi:hypothetical protein
VEVTDSEKHFSLLVTLITASKAFIVESPGARFTELFLCKVWSIFFGKLGYFIIVHIAEIFLKWSSFFRFSLKGGC